MYYNKEGKKISLEEWGEKIDDMEYRVVAQTTTPNGFNISTVWLGLNHSVPGEPLIIFETMAFPPEGEEIVREYQRRYSTIEEAKDGHEKAVDFFTLHTNNRP